VTWRGSVGISRKTIAKAAAERLNRSGRKKRPAA
jgi:hypothetical protein